MYRPTLSLRDRAGPLAAVVLIHVAIGYGLLHLSGADVELARQADLAIFDISLIEPTPPPPPPPPPPPADMEPVKQERKQPKREEGAASPRNIESKATPVVAPEPRITVPAPSPIVAAIIPDTGADSTQGASPVAGPGTGAGGSGTGTGSGGAGGGAGGGGGGNGLGEARARLVTPGLTPRDYPGSLFRRWPRGGAVFIIIRVGADGVPLSCRIARSIGDPAIDSETCRLAVARFRFEPGRDERGRPVADFVGYRQEEYGRNRR